MNQETILKIIIDAENKTNAVFKEVNGKIKEHEKNLKDVTEMSRGLAVAGGVAFGAIAFGVTKMVEASQESAKVQAQLGSVLKSTGGIAGITASKAIELSQALQKQTTYGDEAILSAENMLLTFTNIKDNIFPDATKIVLDMSTALGQDLQSSAMQVGKALQDPIMGVTALRRVGVNFSESQVEVIKALVETGKTAEAQAMIMKELNAEFGGSASAQTETYAGKLKMLNERIGDIYESIGNSLLPILNELLNKINPIITKIGEWIEKNPELNKNIIIIAGAIAGLVTVIGILGLAIPPIIIGFNGIIVACSALGTALVFLATNPIGIVIVAIGLLIAGGVLLYQNWDIVKSKLIEIWDKIVSVFKISINIIVGIVATAFSLIGIDIKQVMGDIVIIIRTSLTIIQTIWKGVTDFIKDITKGWGDTIKAMIGGIVDWISNKFAWITDKMGIIKGITSGISGIASGIGSAISSTANFVYNKGQAITGFANGGIVGGAIGEPMLAIVHGGEKVLTSDEVKNGGQNIIFNFNGDVNDKDALVKTITEMLNRQSTLKGYAGK
jgi:hypothetical protein